MSCDSKQLTPPGGSRAPCLKLTTIPLELPTEMSLINAHNTFILTSDGKLQPLKAISLSVASQ